MTKLWPIFEQIILKMQDILEFSSDPIPDAKLARILSFPFSWGSTWLISEKKIVEQNRVQISAAVLQSLDLSYFFL